MHIVRQAQLLSFLDWNRDNGRELRDLKQIGEADRDRYDALVEAYIETVGITENTDDYYDVKGSTAFEALVDPEWPNAGRMLVGEALSPSKSFERPVDGAAQAKGHSKWSPNHLADRFELVPNRAYLFMTELDYSLKRMISTYLEELSRLSADHIDLTVLKPERDNQSEYDLFSQTYLYQKCKAQRRDIPFFVLYSAKGFVRIDNHKGHFDPYYLRQFFRALPDEFENIDGPASQKQLDKIAERLKALSANPQAVQIEPKKKRRIRWGWIVTLVTLTAGLSTILANFDKAKTTACGFLERANLEVCATPVEPERTQ